MNFLIFKLVFKMAEEPEIKFPTVSGRLVTLLSLGEMAFEDPYVPAVLLPLRSPELYVLRVPPVCAA